MNKRIRKIGIIAVFAIVIAGPLYLLAQSEIIIINNTDVFQKKSRPAVEFTHMNHMTLDGVSCTDCHHLFEDGKNILDPSELTEGNPMIKCSNCHTAESDLERSYHKLCIQCHDKSVKLGKTNGPRMCGDCHKRVKK